jgi:hypothetical protein
LCNNSNVQIECTCETLPEWLSLHSSWRRPSRHRLLFLLYRHAFAFISLFESLHDAPVVVRGPCGLSCSSESAPAILAPARHPNKSFGKCSSFFGFRLFPLHLLLLLRSRFFSSYRSFFFCDLAVVACFQASNLSTARTVSTATIFT